MWWYINAAGALVCAACAVMPRTPLWYRLMAGGFAVLNVSLL